MKSTPLKMKFGFKNILFIYNREQGAQCSTYHSVYPLQNYIVELIENKYRVKGRGQSSFGNGKFSYFSIGRDISRNYPFIIPGGPTVYINFYFLKIETFSKSK